MDKLELNRMLKELRGKVPKQILKTINGQIKSGDLEGAYKGISKVLNRINKGNKE